MDRTLNKPEVGTIDTAILLASSGVFNLGGGAAPSGVGPLTRVGGLTLFQRTVFTLQRGGISQILALVGEEERALRSLIRPDDRVQAAVRWLPVREFPPADPQTWEALRNEIKGSCLILGCYLVFSPSLVELLREEGRDGRVVIAVGSPGDGGWSDNPGVVTRVDPNRSDRIQTVVFYDPREPTSEPASPFAPAMDLVILPSRLLGISGALKTPETGPIRLALEQAAAEGVIQTVTASPNGYLDTRRPHGPRLAERLLLRSLQTVQGGLDGIVDRYVNRRLSGFFTRLFIKLGLSPNAVTILSMLIGLVGAGFFALGSYQLGIIGALLFQLSVIIDCCDGEIARLTFSESRFGQELDILADNVVHMAIFSGIAWGAFVEETGSHTYEPLLLGAIAVVANGFCLWLINQVRHLKARLVRWRQLPGWQRTRLEFILSHVANRDFSVIVLLFACFGMLPWFLWLGAVGSCLFVLTLAWTLRQVFLSHPSASA